MTAGSPSGPMSPEKLSEVAAWLDLYDRMAKDYLHFVDEAGLTPAEADLPGALRAVSSTEVQDDLRRWAEEAVIEERQMPGHVFADRGEAYFHGGTRETCECGVERGSYLSGYLCEVHPNVTERRLVTSWRPAADGGSSACPTRVERLHEQNRRLRAELAGRKHHISVLAEMLARAYSERDRARNTYHDLKRQAADEHMRRLAAEDQLRALGGCPTER